MHENEHVFVCVCECDCDCDCVQSTRTCSNEGEPQEKQLLHAAQQAVDVVGFPQAVDEAENSRGQHPQDSVGDQTDGQQPRAAALVHVDSACEHQQHAPRHRQNFIS